MNLGGLTPSVSRDNAKVHREGLPDSDRAYVEISRQEDGRGDRKNCRYFDHFHDFAEPNSHPIAINVKLGFSGWRRIASYSRLGFLT